MDEACFNQMHLPFSLLQVLPCVTVDEQAAHAKSQIITIAVPSLLSPLHEFRGCPARQS